jgi:hypothetical protein
MPVVYTVRTTVAAGELLDEPTAMVLPEYSVTTRELVPGCSA